MDINDKERLSAIYPELSESQLEEIFLAESAGLDVSSLADKSLSPDDMRAKKEELLLRRARNITAFECRYFYGTIKYFELFDSSREIIYTSLIEEKNGVSYRDMERWASSNGQLQGKVNKIYESLTKNIEVCDIFESAKTLPREYADIVKNIKTEENTSSLEIKFPLNNTFDVYKAFGKGESDKNYAVNVTPDTRFTVRPNLSASHDSYFTLALLSDDFSISIATVPNRSATKSDADVAVCIKDKNTLWYDNAAKYMDTAKLVEGLRS